MSAAALTAMGRLWAIVKLTLFVLLTLILAPLHLLLRAVAKRPDLLPRVYHRVLLRIFGITVTVEGAAPVPGDVVVCNHLSYWDVLALSAVVPAAVFVAKKDVADWPLFGWLAGLQDTVFIDRARQAAKTEVAGLAKRWPRDRTLIVFPEGTSTDGRAVLPFKSSLFAVFCGTPEVVIRPASLILEEVNAVDVAARPGARDGYAWYGEMELAPHLWAFARARGARLRVIFHPPVAVTGDRKDLARTCQERVAAALPA